MTTLPLTFVVPGPPRGKERPRKGKYGNFYTPPKTHAAELAVAMACLKAAGGKLSLQAIHVKVHCHFATHRHPDCDNILKLTLDALEGLAYANDRHVSSEVSFDVGQHPEGIEVTLS